MLADGRILRADRPAVPTVDCLTENPETSGRLFKLGKAAAAPAE